MIGAGRDDVAGIKVCIALSQAMLFLMSVIIFSY